MQLDFQLHIQQLFDPPPPLRYTQHNPPAPTFRLQKKKNLKINKNGSFYNFAEFLQIFVIKEILQNLADPRSNALQFIRAWRGQWWQSDMAGITMSATRMEWNVAYAGICLIQGHWICLTVWKILLFQLLTRVLVDSLGNKVRSFLVPHFDEHSPDVNSDFIFGELRGTFSTITLLQVLVGISTFEHTNWFGYWFLF